MPDGQNGLLDFWSWGVNDVAVSTPVSVALLPQFERPAYEPQPFKWGSSGAPGTSGGTITWSMGAQIPTGAPYTSSASTVGADFQSTIRAAFARWDEVGNFTFVEIADSSAANISVVFDELAGEGASTLGIANTRYSTTTGLSLRAYIRFDIGRTWRNLAGASYTVGSTSSTPTNLYAVALHEIGHALGLAHENDFTTLMNSYYNEGINDLTSDEIAGIHYLYGTGGSVPTVPSADDYAESTATTGTVAVGGSVTGNVDFADDRDWFAVTLTAGTTYRIDLSGNTLADPLLAVRNSNGTLLAYDDDSGPGLDSLLTYTATTTGIYYLEAQSVSYTATGTYTLTVAQVAAVVDDYAGSTATSGALAVGSSVSGNIERSSDSDWFRVTLTAGTTYRIDLTGVTLADTWLVLRNSSGGQITLDHDSGPGLSSQINYTPTSTGTYYLDAQGYLSTHTGTYTLSLTQTAVDDYAASAATTGVLAVGGTASGNIDRAYDSDWFRVTLTAGTTYLINVNGTTLTDPYVRLRNSSGTLITADNDSGVGLNPQISYVPTVTGTYYIDVQGYLSTHTGTYNVTLAQVVDDYANSILSTGALTSPGSVSGRIETSGDSDWFRVSLTAGYTYSFSLTGTTLSDPYLYLRNAAGSVLASDDDSGPGLNALITYRPTTTGAYYLDARALGTGTGNYSLAVSETPPADDHLATTAATGTLTVIGTTGFAVGTIETSGDRDWFRVSLLAGTSYVFEAQGTERTGYTLANPTLTLRNSAGASLASDDDSGTGLSALFYYTPTSSGTYYLDVGATGTGTGIYYAAYTSGVTPPDDYTVTTATTGVVTPGTPGTAASGTINTAGDTDWFRTTLTAGTSYRFRLTNGSLTGAHLYVRDSAGTIVTSDIDGNGNPEILYTPTTSGSYYLDARAATATATGTYSVAVDNVSAEDLAATTATTGSIAAGATLTSTIGVAGDVDWIRVTLTAGTLYQFDGRGAATFGGTLADPLLQLLNSSGAVVRSDDNSGADNDSRLLYTAASTGTYYIAMRSTSATATGTYTVGVTANPDDFTTTTATAGVATVGGTTSGTTEVAGDRDWFRAILTAGTSYAIEVRGTSPGSGLRWTQSSVVLRDASGAQLASDTKSGLGAAARLIYTPSTTGAFYIDALAYSTGVGGYNVTVTAAAASMAPSRVAESQEPSVSAEWAEIMAPPAAEVLEVMSARTVDGGARATNSADIFTALTAPPVEAFFASLDDQNFGIAPPFGAIAPYGQLFNIF